MKKHILTLSALALVNTSCLMYKESTPEKMKELKETAQSTKNMNIPDDWVFSRENTEAFSYDWISEMKDAQLMTLIAEGMAYNADILIAQEKLGQIELAMGIAGSNLYPTVNAVANTNNNVVSGSHIQNLSLKASWELDIWGKNKAGHSAATSQYFSAKYQNDRLKQSIASMIAKSYFLNIAGNMQQAKIEQYLKLTRDLEQLYQVRNRVGTANAMDLSNIKAEIITLESQLEKVKHANQEAKRSLELLTGKYPEGKLSTQRAFSPIKAQIPTEFPLTLLENRADILANQYQIEQAFYEVQQAKAARLPSLSISASVGGAGSNIGALNSLYSNPLLKMGGNLATPIFNGGKLKQNVEIKNSEQRIAVENYSKSVLNALNEVEGALANLHSIEKQIEFSQNAITELEKNVALTKRQISVGTADNFILLQKQRDLLRKEMNLIDLQLQNCIERINLYMALGAEKFEK